jgi:hypothetical protein
MQLLDPALAPDSILPAQLSDRPSGGARIQPEKRLQVAVLADAVLPFRFIGICYSLEFDPGYIRRGLRQWNPHVSRRRDAKEGRGQVLLPRHRRVA